MIIRGSRMSAIGWLRENFPHEASYLFVVFTTFWCEFVMFPARHVLGWLSHFTFPTSLKHLYAVAVEDLRSSATLRALVSGFDSTASADLRAEGSWMSRLGLWLKLVSLSLNRFYHFWVILVEIRPSPLTSLSLQLALHKSFLSNIV